MTDLQRVKRLLDDFGVSYWFPKDLRGYSVGKDLIVLVPKDDNPSWVCYYGSFFEFDKDGGFICFVSSH